MDRKKFIRIGAAGVTGFAVNPFSVNTMAQKNRDRVSNFQMDLKKGYMLGTFPSRNDYTLFEQFQMLEMAGFHGAEPESGLNRTEVLEAMEATGLEVPSVVVSTHWSQPLSSPDADIRKAGLEGLLTALQDAHDYGSKCVLLVPGIANESISYDDAYHRSQEEIRKAIPMAEDLGVTIAIENVWNQFLLSPMEAARYVDEFDTDTVGWYMDVGNIMNFGFPDQWIRILGKRIAMIHIKEYSMEKRNAEGPGAGFRVNYLEGNSNWQAIMNALRDIGYEGGYGIAEPAFREPSIPHLQWLQEFVSERLDRIFEM